MASEQEQAAAAKDHYEEVRMTWAVAREAIEVAKRELSASRKQERVARKEYEKAEFASNLVI